MPKFPDLGLVRTLLANWRAHLVSCCFVSLLLHIVLAQRYVAWSKQWTTMPQIRAHYVDYKVQTVVAIFNCLIAEILAVLRD